MKGVVFILGLFALVLGSVQSAASQTFSTETTVAGSPSALADSSFSAALRQRSVHYDLTTSHGNGARTTMVCDVDRSSGVQRVTFAKGGRTGRVLIYLVGQAAYVCGDAFALNTYMGFREAGSQLYAGRWIKVPRSDSAYAPIAAAVTLGSEIDNLRFVSVDPAILVERIDGLPVLLIRGTRSNAPPDTARLYVRAHGSPLPVAAKVTAFSGATYTTRFGNWNEPINVSAPRHSVPIKTTNLE